MARTPRKPHVSISSLPYGPAIGGVASIGLYAANQVTRKMVNIQGSVFPNTITPAGTGRFGIRTARDAGPAGIEGLKFQFRRR